MAVRYLTDRPTERLYDVIQWRERTSLWIVKLNPDRSLWRHVVLHWLNGERTNYPCRGDECTLCHLSSKICTYVPVLAWLAREKYPDIIADAPRGAMILPVLHGLRAILDDDLAGVYLTRRVGKKTNSPVKHVPYTHGLPFQRVPDFDIVPTLERMWGAQSLRPGQA